eukprot:7049591-Prymnesium_polylepis.1
MVAIASVLLSSTVVAAVNGGSRIYASRVAPARSLHARMQLDGANQQPGYQMPPASIAELADAKPIPSVSVQPVTCEHLLHIGFPSMLTLDDLVAPVLKLGGERFNPCTLIAHGGSGIGGYSTHLEVQTVRSGEKRSVSGLPPNARIEDLASVSYTHLTLPTICSV